MTLVLNFAWFWLMNMLWKKSRSFYGNRLTLSQQHAFFENVRFTSFMTVQWWCIANQWTGFYMIVTSFIKELMVYFPIISQPPKYVKSANFISVFLIKSLMISTIKSNVSPCKVKRFIPKICKIFTLFLVAFPSFVSDKKLWSNETDIWGTKTCL